MATAPKRNGASLCVHEGAGHNHSNNNGCEELDLTFDPTLASCCERDEHEYKKAMKLKALLTAHDPTSSAVQRRQQLFDLPAVTSPRLSAPIYKLQQLEQCDVESDSDNFEDSDDEFGMEAMMTARRKQLVQQMKTAAQNLADGYEVVLDISLPQLVQELQIESEIPRVALVVNGGAATHFLLTMRDVMTTVAQQFIGTKFYVAKAVRNEDGLRQLRLSSALTLAAFRRGDCVDSIALDPTMSVTELDILWETRFLPWLKKCNVLVSERKKSESNMGRKKRVDEDKTEHEGFDCGVETCRLRFGYEHEHVGPSQKTKNEIAAWRQSSA